MTYTFVSMSGGKDSAAAGLHLKDLEIETGPPVFLDTGWEAPQTYQYLLEELPKHFGPIDWRVPTTPELPPEAEAVALEFEERLAHPLGHPCHFIRQVLRRGFFPSAKIRFCTQELKINTIRSYRKELPAMAVNVVGIRAEESPRRAKMKERELDPGLDLMVWRPLIDWTLDDVQTIHSRHNLTPNPLYLTHFKRVGCYPCINAPKAAVRGLGRDEERVRLISDLEKAVARLNPKSGDRGETFFKGRVRGGENKHPIEDVVSWANTSHGGRQLQLFEPDELGCVSWGLCGT
jgi:3'-phosphoadenosine 5'-phosphosulfate sulfotransferase (PAPS reductase)/FAD synthetase